MVFFIKRKKGSKKKESLNSLKYDKLDFFLKNVNNKIINVLYDNLEEKLELIALINSYKDEMKMFKETTGNCFTLLRENDTRVVIILIPTYKSDVSHDLNSKMIVVN